MKKKIFIYCSILFILDFIVKLIIKNTFILTKSIIIIPNFFNLTYVINDGAAFSILRDKQILLIIITVIALFFIYKYVNKEELGKYDSFAFSMITGGILGNLLDRIAYNYVIDFIDFKIFGYDFPVFNLADTFIVIGVILLIIKTIKESINEFRSKRK